MTVDRTVNDSHRRKGEGGAVSINRDEPVMFTGARSGMLQLNALCVPLARALTGPIYLVAPPKVTPIGSASSPQRPLFDISKNLENKERWPLLPTH